MYSTLYTIRESPVQRGVIWTGSNDGLVYVTRDDGKTWTNVTPKDMPPGGRIQNIEPSPHRGRERLTSRCIDIFWATSRRTFTAPTISARRGRG